MDFAPLDTAVFVEEKPKKKKKSMLHQIEEMNLLELEIAKEQ